MFGGQTLIIFSFATADKEQSSVNTTILSVVFIAATCFDCNGSSWGKTLFKNPIKVSVQLRCSYQLRSQLITTAELYTTFHVFLNNLYPEDDPLRSKHVATINNTDNIVGLTVFVLFSHK
jgi:radical SAM superfamily enzyme